MLDGAPSCDAISLHAVPLVCWMLYAKLTRSQREWRWIYLYQTMNLNKWYLWLGDTRKRQWINGKHGNWIRVKGRSLSICAFQFQVRNRPTRTWVMCLVKRDRSCQLHTIWHLHVSVVGKHLNGKLISLKNGCRRFNTQIEVAAPIMLAGIVST